MSCETDTVNTAEREQTSALNTPGVKGMNKNTGFRHGISAMLLPAIFCAAPNLSWATQHDEDDDDEVPFDEAQLFFELNNTDGDLGIHALIDGEPWRKLKIENQRDRSMLTVWVQGQLRKQGLTEIFFESAEPTFDELSPKNFFRRFKAGTYEIEGKSLDGYDLESEVELTHTMPAPPEPTVNGNPKAEQCDDEEPGFDATVVSPPVTIAWEAVTMSHPDAAGGGAGVQPPIPVTIHNYEVVVEAFGDDFESKLFVIIPPGQTSMTIPEDFLDLAEEFKYEVLAREESYNQTAVESCFVLDD